MAPPASETSRGRAMRLLGLLAPFPGRLEFSFRLALICALTALVCEIYQTPEPALTVYVAFFLIKPDRVSSVVLSLVLLGVLTVTLLIVLAAATVVADQPVWRVGTMTLLSFALIFLASASKLREVAPIMALIAAYALDLLGTIQIGEIATRALLYAWLFVGIPAGVSMLVNLLGGPAPRLLAERALVYRLRLAAAMLRGPAEQTRHEFEEALNEGIGEILAWLKLAGAEKTASTADLAALRQATESVLRIMLLVDIASRAPQALLSPACSRELAETFGAMAGILASGSHPIEIEEVTEPPRAAPEAASWQAEMRETLTHFALPPQAPAIPAKASAGFLATDAFTNPMHVHHALKTTGAAMFCYILYSLLDWPTIHTCLITCYIVSLGTAAEAVEKLTLRVLGCMLGAAVGIAAIVFLVPDLTSIGGLMITVFLAALASAWVAGGSTRIAYAGYQIAFAFFLCVLQGNGPSFDMVTARDRVIGILLGNVVVYLVFTNIWPVSVAARIDPDLIALLRGWSTVLRAGGEAAILAASQALAATGILVRDLDLTTYEPGAIRPAPEWLQRRRRAANELTALAGPLWFNASRAPGQSKDVAAWMDRLADGVGKPAIPARTSLPLEVPTSIEAGLRRLETLLNDRAGDEAVEPNTRPACAAV
jgi:multidrug resistance protein MdtO